MFRRSLPAILLVLIWSATLPVLAAKRAADVEPPDAKALVRRANELWNLEEDYSGALDAFNRAVDATPNDGDVRLQRAGFLEYLSGIVVKDEIEKFKALAREDYRKIAGDEPDTTRSGVARDGLTRLAGKTLLSPAPFTCPSEAMEAHERAASLYGARHMKEAAKEYDKATAACPSAAPYWVDYADTYYVLKKYDKAKQLFLKALEADPWCRSGHRFLADTEARLGDIDGAVHEAALAVVSDPVYEAAWASLRNYANASGRGWRRVYGAKTQVTPAPSGANGDSSIAITLPAGEGLARGTPGPGKNGKDVDPDGTGWIAYGLTKASALTGTAFENDASGKPVERKVDPKTMTALELERLAVRGTLQALHEVTASSSKEPGPFWLMMDRAERSAFLDEAIFLHMLDAPLAAEYPAFREKNADRLVQYLGSQIVPKD